MQARKRRSKEEIYSIAGLSQEQLEEFLRPPRARGLKTLRHCNHVKGGRFSSLPKRLRPIAEIHLNRLLIRHQHRLSQKRGLLGCLVGIATSMAKHPGLYQRRQIAKNRWKYKMRAVVERHYADQIHLQDFIEEKRKNPLRKGADLLEGI